MNKHHIIAPIPPACPEDQERILDELRDVLKEAMRLREQNDLAAKEVLKTIQAFRRECNL